MNWKTGRKQPFVTFDQLEKTCPATATDHVFIGRTGKRTCLSVIFYFLLYKKTFQVMIVD